MTQFQKRERDERWWQFDRWGAPIAGVLLVVFALLGIAASNAEPAAGAHGFCMGDDCDSRHRGHWGHRGHHRRGSGAPDPELAKEHMQYATGWMLRRLEVEDEVQEQIQDRLGIAFEELVPLIEAHRDTRETWIEAVFGSEEVNRTGLEAQRQSAIAAADRATLIIADAISDVAEMLTPEQRAEVAEKIRSHHR